MPITSKYLLASIVGHQWLPRKITLRKVGGSIGATLPKDMADRLNVEAGDEVFAVETEQGLLITPLIRRSARQWRLISARRASIATRCANCPSSAMESHCGSRAWWSERSTPIRSGSTAASSVCVTLDCESSLARPKNTGSHDQDADPAALAAEYGFGLAKNHAFVDGNKRIAFVATNVFLMLNGFKIEAEEPEVVDTMMRLADGCLSRNGFANWIRRVMAPYSE